MPSNSRVKRPVALLDVDHTLIADPKKHTVLNQPLLDSLSAHGIRNVYLFTDMLPTLPDMLERLILIRELEEQGFTVHGVIIPSDLVPLDKIKEQDVEDGKRHLALANQKKYAKKNNGKHALTKEEEEELNRLEEKVTNSANDAHEKEHNRSNTPNILGRTFNAAKEIIENDPKLLLYSKKRIKFANEVKTHALEHCSDDTQEKLNALREKAELIKGDWNTPLQDEKGFAHIKGNMLEHFIQHMPNWAGNIVVADDKKSVIEAIEQVANPKVFTIHIAQNAVTDDYNHGAKERYDTKLQEAGILEIDLPDQETESSLLSNKQYGLLSRKYAEIFTSYRAAVSQLNKKLLAQTSQEKEPEEYNKPHEVVREFLELQSASSAMFSAADKAKFQGVKLDTLSQLFEMHILDLAAVIETRLNPLLQENNLEEIDTMDIKMSLKFKNRDRYEATTRAELFEKLLSDKTTHKVGSYALIATGIILGLLVVTGILLSIFATGGGALLVLPVIAAIAKVSSPGVGILLGLIALFTIGTGIELDRKEMAPRKAIVAAATRLGKFADNASSGDVTPSGDNPENNGFTIM